MNKTKIDWADRSWNPVTGCLHNCQYCYAKKIIHRFKGFYCFPSGKNCIGDEYYPADEKYVILDSPMFLKGEDGKMKKLPYPLGNKPTLHRYRLGEPLKLKEPQTIFVVSMGDLFGEWMPCHLIDEVFKACEAAPQHRYLFLTKNPDRYRILYDELPKGDNYWYGYTATQTSELRTTGKGIKTFVSIEPILSPVHLHGDLIPDWVIIGAESGNRKGKVIPRREWIEDIAEACKSTGTPVFMKESLRGLMGEDFIQEYPWETDN
jgi:protein gp37